MPRSRQILILILALVVLGGGAYYMFVMRAEEIPETPPVDTSGIPTAPPAGTTPPPGATPPPSATPPPGSTPPPPAAGALQVVEGVGVSGNNTYALDLATQVAKLAAKNKLIFEVDIQLIPAAGGFVPKGAKRLAYRNSVTAASMRIVINDATTMQQWTASKRTARTTAVTGYLKLLLNNMPKSARTVIFVQGEMAGGTGTPGSVIAVGDSVAGSSTNTVKLF